jgi:hypothetical protein
VAQDVEDKDEVKEPLVATTDELAIVEATGSSAEAAPSSPQSTMQSGNLLAAYLPANSPGPSLRAASPSEAARAGGGLLAAYEERAALPRMPPPSPATPSAALAYASAKMPDLAQAQAAEVVQAAGVALGCLATQDASSSPSPSSPNPEGASTALDEPRSPARVIEEKSSPAVPLSPLSLESQSPDPAYREIDTQDNDEDPLPDLREVKLET